MPGFCNPMAFNIPLGVSVTLGVGLPGQGTLATPLVTMAPKRFKSTNRPYSIPEPKVPEAVMTGFFNSTPAILTLVSIPISPLPWNQIPVLRYRLWCYLHANAHLCLRSWLHNRGRHRHHRPFSLPEKCMRCILLPRHIF